MNAYEAAIKTADLFEQKPEMFDFFAVVVPECHTPGCAIGYIGHFMGQKGLIDGLTTVGIPEPEFYDRMTDLTGASWSNSAYKCAKGLRLYAEKYLKP
jgi:hypothetical protein